MRVLVTTACSACDEHARMARKVPGNWKPWPSDEGTRTSRYVAAERTRRRRHRHAVPATCRAAPSVSGHLRRRVQVMAKPVLAPATEEMSEGRTRRRPDEVALVRRTAWK